jgi:regulatory protein
MPCITALERQPRRRNFELQIDGQPAITISQDICVQFGLRAGDEISDERLSAVREAEERHKAMKSALRLLSYRPRSEREIRDRLARKGIRPEIRDATVSRLRETGLIDDEAYARTFVESRDRTSPRARRLIAAELRTKGVGRHVVEEATAEVDDRAAAYRAAARRARSLTRVSFAEFRRRLGDFLVRRGFDYETAEDTVSRLWGETARREPEFQD